MQQSDVGISIVAGIKDCEIRAYSHPLEVVDGVCYRGCVYYVAADGPCSKGKPCIPFADVDEPCPFIA
ncbi:hypothetical protein SDC9_102525 [bioreactor metagenome]|uniref:Uncharacterized protein n=1 Tax=bioreactor metagenome TaxID=1076179 RepID=A0A645ASK1_9ZZZZ